MVNNVSFSSTKENWIKEFSGIKNNTIRKKNIADIRHLSLIGDMNSNSYGKITIQNEETQQEFTRKITDVTIYDDYLIISWRDE